MAEVPAQNHSMGMTRRERLEVASGLVYRYEESRAAGEGAFGICSFWVAEYLARGGGTLDEAETWFRDVLGYANDLGIFAEEIDPVTGEPLGNVPQAFTHVGLIGAALAIVSLAIFRPFFEDWFPQDFTLFSAISLNAGEAFWIYSVMAVIGCVVGAAGAGVAVTRFLDI